MTESVTVPAIACTCDLCGYRWISIALQPPQACQSRLCRSRQWNGARRRSRPKIALPSPRGPGRRRSIALIDIHRES